ncbi:hypothetical protein ACF0H5_019068 [Mactra antiquata]
MFTSTLVVLLLCVFVLVNGYGLSDNNGSNSTKTTISRLQLRSQATDNASNRRTTTTSPNSNRIDSMKLQLEILELQRMQKSLLSDMANGQTTKRKQRLLREIEQQIEVRRSRRKLLQTTEAPQVVHTTKFKPNSKTNNEGKVVQSKPEVEKPQIHDKPADNRQEEDTSQNRPQQVQQKINQHKQMIQAPPPPIHPVQNRQQQTQQVFSTRVQPVQQPQEVQQQRQVQQTQQVHQSQQMQVTAPQQTSMVQQMVPAPNQILQGQIKNVQFLGSQRKQSLSASNQNAQAPSSNSQYIQAPVVAQQQQVNQNNQMLQAQQFMPSLQIPPLMPHQFMAPQFIQPSNNNISAPGNGLLPLQQLLFPMNTLVNGQNNRYIVVDAGANMGDNSVQMSEFGNQRVTANQKRPPKPPTTVSPTVATTLPTTTTTVATTTKSTTKKPATMEPTPPTTTLSPSDEKHKSMLDMDLVKMSYYEDSITKQKLEIQKLRLEVRALQREERQNMGGGENENEDGPNRQGMFDPRNMFGPRQMPPFMSMFG